jgi:hypothetical protein
VLQAVGEHGAVHGRLGLGNQLPQPGRELGCGLIERWRAAGVGRVVGKQAGPRPHATASPSRTAPKAVAGREASESRPMACPLCYMGR